MGGPAALFEKNLKMLPRLSSTFENPSNTRTGPIMTQAKSTKIMILQTRLQKLKEAKWRCQAMTRLLPTNRRKAACTLSESKTQTIEFVSESPVTAQITTNHQQMATKVMLIKKG